MKINLIRCTLKRGLINKKNGARRKRTFYESVLCIEVLYIKVLL